MGKRIVFAITALSLAGLVASSLVDHDPRLIWNRTESVPKGFYLIQNTPLEHGMLVAYRPTQIEADWLLSRGITGTNWPLLKRLLALEDDIVCWRSGAVSINNKHVGTVLEGIDLAANEGCVQLGHGDVFLMNAHPRSVDGRYFGIQKTENIIGAATLLWRASHRASELRHKVISGEGREADVKGSRRARLKARLSRDANLLSAHLFLCDAASGGSHSLDQSALACAQNPSVKAP